MSSPTFVASYHYTHTGTATTGVVSAGPFTPNPGELLVIKIVSMNGDDDEARSCQAPWDGIGQITYTLQAANVPGDSNATYCSAYLYTGQVGASPSPMSIYTQVQNTGGDGSDIFLVVERWANAFPTSNICNTTWDGIHRSAPSTTINALTNSYVTWVGGDIRGDDTTITYLNSATETFHYQKVAYECGYAAYQPVTSSGAQTIGMSSPNQQAWTLLGVELANPTIIPGTATLAASGSISVPVTQDCPITLTGAGDISGSLLLNMNGVASLSAKGYMWSTEIGGTTTSWTTNLCPNPSFETDLTGWASTDSGTSILQTNLQALYGTQSMQVTTSGTIAGQGVIGPMSANIGASPIRGSVTLSIYGETGTVIVTAVANPGGVSLGSLAVVLNGSEFQTVVLNDLLYPANSSIYVVVQTSSPQDIVFNIDGVMYEPESPAHPYCDGNQYGCFWEGTTNKSPSYQPYQWGIAEVGSTRWSGQAAIIVPGAAVGIEAETSVTWGGSAAPVSTVLSPVAAMTDFGIWTTADPDPAMTYASWNNTGILSSTTAYTRPYAQVVPPLDYPVSGGALAWKRAAYMALGFQWPSVVNHGEQIITDVQVEMAKINGVAAITPQSYFPPRQLVVTISPNRLNYITNPSFETSTAGWTGTGTGEVLTKVTSSTITLPTNVATYNNTTYTAGTHCLQVELPTSAATGTQISVPYLIPGRTYVCSAYVAGTAQMQDITLSGSAGGGADVIGALDIPYGGVVPLGQGYGSGPYGGVPASNTPLTAQEWFHIYFSFVASSDTVTITIAPTMITSPTYPTYFWVEGVLLEAGDILYEYFDGNSGPDAMWETGGTTNLSRSYYYNQYEYGQHIVSDALASNTPYGISVATPKYATIPSQ